MIHPTEEPGFAGIVPGKRAGRLMPTALALFVPFGCGVLSVPFIPSSEDLQAFDASQQAFREQVESLPLINVTIINETTAQVRIELVSGLAGPQFPVPEPFGGFGSVFSPMEPSLEQVDFRTVLADAGGTVTGTLRCGEVIAVSATAPAKQAEPESFGFGRNPFGLSVSDGNIAFSGIGTGADTEGTFSGDIVYSARFIQPETDGVGCETDTLVIRVLTAGSTSVYDSETGQLVIGGSHGVGTLSLE